MSQSNISCPKCPDKQFTEKGIKIHNSTVHKGKDATRIESETNGEKNKTLPFSLDDMRNLIKDELRAAMPKGNGSSAIPQEVSTPYPPIIEKELEVVDEIFISRSVKLRPKILEYFRWTSAKNAEKGNEELDFNEWLNDAIEEFYVDHVGVESVMNVRPQRRTREKIVI